MNTLRKITVEVGESQVEVTYDGRDATTQYGDLNELESAVEGSLGRLGGFAFEPIQGESSYRGWSRFSVSVSPPMCQVEDCIEFIEYQEQATQICIGCQLDQLADQLIGLGIVDADPKREGTHIFVQVLDESDVDVDDDNREGETL